MTKITKAVIPAAGLGTRFLPATKAVPKEMLPIIDKPAIQYIVEEAAASGITEILIIIAPEKGTLVNHFGVSPSLTAILESRGNFEDAQMLRDISKIANIHFTVQHKALGLGDAVRHAKAFVGDDPFAILLGDDIICSKTPCTKQLINIYNTYGCSVLGVNPVKEEDISKYGIVLGDKISEKIVQVSNMVEKPAPQLVNSNLAVMGRYIITPQIFEILENTLPGNGGEIQLTDALCSLLETQDIYAYSFEGKRYDAGSKIGFLKAIVDFALQREDLKDEFLQYIKTAVGEKNEQY